MTLISRFIVSLLAVLFFSSTIYSQVNKHQLQNFNTKQPSRFTENKGQITDQNGNLRPDVKYIYSVPGFKAIFKANSFSYEVFTVEKKPNQISEATGKPIEDNLLADKFKQPEDVTVKTHRIDIDLPGANKHPEIIVEGKSTDYNNYYLAHTPEEGVQKVYSYTKLTYKDIWPKVDIVFYAKKEGELKYDIVVHPGGKLENIEMKYDGAGGLSLAEGKLKLNTALGKMREDIPFSFLCENKQEVKVKYLLKANKVTFNCIYDKSKTLVVDPQLTWETYYGGSDVENARGISTDASGNVYITGETISTSGIATTGAHQTTYMGGGKGSNAFLAKFNSSGVMQWGTYYSGNSTAFGYGISTDKNGNIFIIGYCYSSSGIATSGAHQTTAGGSSDAYVAKFNSSGIRQWGTYYGGSGEEYGRSITTDDSDNVYITGYTNSNSTSAIATSGAYQSTFGGWYDVFIAKFNNNGDRQWGTYFGGAGSDHGYSIRVDASANVYVTGLTASTTGIATNSAHQTTFGGVEDAFLVKFSSTGVREWSTYYGDNNIDIGNNITTDGNRNVYMVGYTASTSSIATTSSYQSTFSGGYDAFLVKFDSVGKRLWSTYYGGTWDDYGNSVAIDGWKNIFMVGYTSSTSSIATTGSYQTTNGGGNDAYLVKFDSTGKRLWGTYYGGIGNDQGQDISLQGCGNLFITGSAGDAFIVKFFDSSGISINLSGDSLVCSGSIQSYSTNKATGLNYSWIVSGGTILSGQNTNSITVAWGSNGVGSIKLVVGLSSLKCKDSISKKVTVYAKPNTSITGDSFVCPTSITYFKSKAAASYSWNVTGGKIQSGQNSDSIIVLWNAIGKGTIKLVNTNSTGCKDSSILTIKIDSSACNWVWPGDANADKVVDNKDILAIGIAYSDTGSARIDTSTIWRANLVKDWSNNFSSGQNHKHADCNGDGVVSYVDTLAVTRNYTKAHAKKESKNRGKNTDPVLRVAIANDSFEAGDTLVAYILLGENALPAKDVYGLAFSLNYNKDVYSSVSVDYSGNWLGANTLGYSNNTNGLDLALTKTDQKDTTGSGRIATIRLITDKSQELDFEQLKLEIVDNILISANEQVIPTNVKDDSVKIYKEPNGIFKSNNLEQAQVRVYPNPFTIQTNIEITLQKSSTVSMILYDMTGKSYTVFKSTKQPEGKSSFTLDTKPYNFPAGMYVLKVLVDGVPTYKRIAKTD